MDALQRIRIVLCHTTHPGNIGAAARAMKTMGLERLVLVEPRHFPNDQATARATGADDVLERAQVCSTLDEALRGVTFAVGFTARRRELSHPMLPVRELGNRLPAETRSGEVALVFGTEMSGLSNAELDHCQQLAEIPTDPHFASLNLAAAVQVACYEVRQALVYSDWVEPSAVQPLAEHEDLEGFYRHLEAVIRRIGFLDPDRPGRLMIRLRRLFARARPEPEEINLLRGILSAVDGLGSSRGTTPSEANHDV